MPTLQEIEESDWGDPDSGETKMVQRCLALRRKPLADFDDEDLRLMIGQQIGTDQLVPLGIEAVRSNPQASGNMFEGALLENILGVEDDWWKSNQDDEAHLIEIIKKINWSEAFERGVREKAVGWIEDRGVLDAQ